MSARRRRPKGLGVPIPRSIARLGAAILLVLLCALSGAGVWFVHHPRAWIDARRASWPSLITRPLLFFGNPVGDFTDAIGLTGEDVTLPLARPAPTNRILFAGLPVRKGAPAPDDIKVLDRGEFLVGWSPRLRHPVWCAYHVPRSIRFPSEKRPGFKKDKSVPGSPTAGDYTRTGYDRGHMVPNYASVTRFGPEIQERTFLMSNIAPQTPQLNRGVWRDIEHRIAELWTERWGEIWVIVGCLSNGQETLSGTSIDVPTHFYQVVVAQKDDEVRAFAVLFEQDVPWQDWPTRYLVTIDEIERLSGLDFLSDLDDATEEALEARLPSRLWPVSFTDLFRLLVRRSAN